MRDRFFIILVGVAFLTSCASENDIPMQNQFWQTQQDKIAIGETPPITPFLYKIGGQGLVDYAINSTMTFTLDKKISQSDVNWYKNLPHQFSLKLQEHHKTVKEISTYLKDNKNSLLSYSTSTKANELLLINLEAYGAIRQYHAFIPTSTPKGYCILTGKLIDLRTNKILWRHRAISTQELKGPWYEPPYYPNVTNAMKIAAKNAQEELLNGFFLGH